MAVKRVKILPDWLSKSVRQEIKNEGDVKKMFIIAVEDLIDIKEYLIKEKPKKEEEVTSNRVDHDVWAGTETYQSYIDMFSERTELGAQVSELVLKKTGTIEKDSDSHIYDTHGLFYDVGEVLSGTPEAWLRPEIERYSNKTAHITLNLSYNGSYSAEELLNNAKNILAGIELLSQHKINVRIDGVHFSKLNSEESYTHKVVCVKIKGHNDIFDWGKLRAVLNPSFLRRFVFRIQEVNDVTDNNDYGYSKDLNSEDVLNLTESYEPEKIFEKFS